jgi:hypothetical protein
MATATNQPDRPSHRHRAGNRVHRPRVVHAVNSSEVTLIVDVANVMGSRPDGWWRDRAGAASRLLASLAPLLSTPATAPSGEPIQISRILAVTEGQARTAIAPPTLEVIAAPADGDTTIVIQAHQILTEGQTSLVITADRGLRARLPEGTMIAGPRWLLDLIPPSV